MAGLPFSPPGRFLGPIGQSLRHLGALLEAYHLPALPLRVSSIGTFGSRTSISCSQLVARHDLSSRQSFRNDDECRQLAPSGRVPGGARCAPNRNTNGFLTLFYSSIVALFHSAARLLDPLGHPCAILGPCWKHTNSQRYRSGPPPWKLLAPGRP